MPSWAWVVTMEVWTFQMYVHCFNALTGLSCYDSVEVENIEDLQFQCPHGLELLPDGSRQFIQAIKVSMPSQAWVVTCLGERWIYHNHVSMPSQAWVVTGHEIRSQKDVYVSMPSQAWVVTARMSNILNFSWYFLFIPAIYRCILAHLPIFFNQLSKFLRCESPSTFLGTCLSHHSFIIFLVTNTNTLLSGLYLISTDLNSLYYEIPNMVSMPSRAYTSFLQ